MKQLTKNQIRISTGTHLQGHIKCSYRRIVEVFGEPSEGIDKTDAEWVIQFPCGTIATIYNWKDGINYCGEEGTPTEQIIEWHVGGFTNEAVELVKKELLQSLTKGESRKENENETEH